MAGNSFSSGAIQINGNGNIVGNGNRVTNVRNTTINNSGGPGGGSGGGSRNNGNKDSNGNGAYVVFALIGGAIALAALSFWFTRYSEVIYKILMFSSLAGGTFSAFSAAKQTYDCEYMEGLRSLCVTVVAAITFMSVGSAVDTMPADLLAFSKSGTFNTFWCGLSLFGQQVASHHSVTGTFVLVPLVAFILLQSMRSTVVALSENYELPEGIQSLIQKVAGGRAFTAMCVVCILCVAAHSDAGDQFWKEQFNARVSLFCPVK